MRFHWTHEKPPLPRYALRDSNGYTHAAITGKGMFYGLLFEPGLPDSGPYKCRQDAADWIAKMMVQLNPNLKDSVFEKVPK